MAYLEFVHNPILKQRAEAAFGRLEDGERLEALHRVTDAGDAIEALLADRLLTMGVEGFDAEGILKMPLAALIDKAKGQMGEATVSFCQGVRLARDLVHSTRQARTGDSLTPNHARVAHAVAELVRQEMAKYEAEPSPAYNAHLSIISHPGVWDTIPELLNELSQHDRDQLLLTVLPEAVTWILKADEDDELDAELPLSREMASICLDTASPQVRAEFMTRLVHSLRHARRDRPEARNLLRLFFFSERLPDLPEKTRSWLLAFAVGVLRELKEPEWPCWAAGLAAEVKPDKVSSVIRVLSYNAVKERNEEARHAGEKQLNAELVSLSGARFSAAITALDSFISSCEQRGDRVAADRLARIRYKAQPIEDDDIPRQPASE